MRHNWIIDVLDDLRAFAVQNELHDLAQQLEKAAEIARSDDVTVASGAAIGARTNDVRPRRISAQG